jgi:predicted phosphodiesterase
VRVQILSDLHFEFDDDGGEPFARAIPVAGEILVLAGDIIPLTSAERVNEVLGWFCRRFWRVLYVPGNHEYYGTSPGAANALLGECAAGFPNLHVLNPSEVTIEGRRFVGATLWFPPTVDEATYRPFLSDFSLIEGFVPWVHETHAAHLAFLEATVRPGDVVVTHFLPHPGSIATQFSGNALNRFFVAEDAAPLVQRAEAHLWIHGHTHVAFDYRVGSTRVVCNPRGYPGEPGTSFDPGLVIEV